MKVTCGVDIIEIDRVKESIESLEDKFLNRVFTEKEIKYCESRKAQKYQHYAARFAAKEATFKAVSTNLNDKYSICWKDIEVINSESGRPVIVLYHKIGEKISDIDISMSHCKQYAVANVVVNWK